MKPNRINTLIVLFATLALLLALAGAALAQDPTYSESWDGKRGVGSIRCDYAGQPGRPATGWIHWVFNTKGDSTDAKLVLGGTGSGEYAPGEPLSANVWHFYTPYFELNGLTATIYLFGGAPGPGGGLVISDYCPGQVENLMVEKTVETSFTREHFWDIAKKVETENGYTHNGLPKIWLWTDGRGDETATWTIDVSYEGFEDSDWNVSGVITITNTGALDAVITSVSDVLGGSAISVDCGVTFPFTLPVGGVLTCTYSEDGYFEGKNVVTVTTERASYSAEKDIVWGDPTTEVNKTVHIKDISDLFGEVALGTATAPNGAQFTYTKDFAFGDFARCGDFRYDNTAMIVETEQEAEATLLVNVQCYIWESAWAKGGNATCAVQKFRQWGWTNWIPGPGQWTWPLWAGAGQCDTSKGTLVGTVHVVYDPVTYVVTVHFNINPGYGLGSTAVYAGKAMWPKLPNGRDTFAPGQYRNFSPFDGGPVWVIAHANVGMPDPNFGP